MRELIKPITEELNNIKIFFKEKYIVVLSEEEAKEVYLSLYYLGKALYRSTNLNKGVKSD